MTDKLYYQSSYIKSWSTTIKKLIEKEGEKIVVLESTAFYPTGGGQPCDRGKINGIAVLDVYTEGTDIYHKVERLPELNNVVCEIDWQTRFDHMQQHSGQHLLSAECLRLFQAKTIAFHLGPQSSTIDIDMPDLSMEQCKQIEDEVNAKIYQNRKIKSYFVSNEELQQLPVVKMPQVTDDIRIVEIEGIEYNPCGGTHVDHTGELGVMKIWKIEKIKGHIRIHFKCGNRALKDYQEVTSIVNTFAKKFNTGRETLLTRFEKWENGKKETEQQLVKLKDKLAEYEIKNLLENKVGSTIISVDDEKRVKDLLMLANKILLNHNVVIIFASVIERKIIFVHNGERQINCGQIMKEHLSQFNGKGGGNNTSAQASFEISEDMLRFFQYLKQLILLENEA